MAQQEDGGKKVNEEMKAHAEDRVGRYGKGLIEAIESRRRRRKVLIKASEDGLSYEEDGNRVGRYGKGLIKAIEDYEEDEDRVGRYGKGLIKASEDALSYEEDEDHVGR